METDERSCETIRDVIEDVDSGYGYDSDSFEEMDTDAIRKSLVMHFHDPKRLLSAMYPECDVGKFGQFVAGLNAEVPEGKESPLMTAAGEGLNDRVRLLIHFGADINLTSADGRTAFSVACDMKKFSTMRLLLESGAVVKRHSIPALAAMLEVHCTDPYYMHTLLILGLEKNWDDVVDLLLGRFKLNVNSVCTHTTPLIEAVRKNDLGLMVKLVNYGAELNFKSTCLSTPLHTACKQGNYEITKYLLDGGAEVDILNSSGRTPLFACARRGNLRLVRLLFEKGASVNVRDRAGNNALLYGYCTNRNKDKFVDVVKCFLKDRKGQQ